MNDTETADAVEAAPALSIRVARRDDVARLLALEEAVFTIDRLERRNFRHAVWSRSMAMLLAEGPNGIAGYALTEFRRGSRAARLTSLAAATPGLGTGGRLLAASEAEAIRRGCDRMRLEVRTDNAVAIRLYARAGYRQTDTFPDFYEDGETALRLEKPLTG